MSIRKSILFVAVAPLMAGAARADDAPTLDGKPLPHYSAPSTGLLAEIKKRGKLIDGVEAATPPYEFVKDGKVVGFDIDLAQLFARDLGVELEVVDTAWSGIIPSLYADKFDMIWSALHYTPARAKAITLSPIYATDPQVFLVRSDENGIKAVDDLKSRIVGAQLNSFITDKIKLLDSENKLRIDLKLYDAMPQAFLDLANGNLEVVGTSHDYFSELEKASPGKFKIAYELPTDMNSAMVVGTRKPDKDLSDAVAAFIQKIQANGQLDELSMKWFGYKKPIPKQ